MKPCKMLWGRPLLPRQRNLGYFLQNAYKSACMALAYRPEMRDFRGWPIQRSHAKCCGADSCCHGNEHYTTTALPLHTAQARREPPRGPGNHKRGAQLSQPYSVCAEIERPKASRGRKRGAGGVSPQHPTRGWGAS